MNTAQIIIIIIFSLLAYGTSIKLHFESDRKHDGFFIVNFVAFSFILMIAVTSLITMNSLLKNNKCPEYEKIENVYKLKEK